jgi:hypothetical protein
MTNRLDVDRFKDVIKKSTLDLALPGTQLHFKNGKMYSQMISELSDIITILEIDNDIIELSQEDDITLRFREPAQGLFPHLDILENSEASADAPLAVDIKIYDESTDARIILKPKYEVFGVGHIGEITVQMVAESVLRGLVLSRQKRDGISYFSEMPITPELMKLFNWIKKIGIQHPNVYFEVKDGTLTVESSDRNNTYGNATKYTIKESLDVHDLIIAFSYKSFVHLLNVITDEQSKEDGKELKFGCAYFDQDQGSGMIHVTAQDQSEQYFLLSTGI